MLKLASLALLFAAACGMMDNPASFVDRDRVLAARVTVDSDPMRAWPAPGESATVTWISAAPDGAPNLNWQLAACPSLTSTGMPICVASPFAAGEGSGATPTLAFTVPTDIAVDTVAVFGGLCASGSPIMGKNGMAACDDGSRADTIVRYVFVAGAQSNRNPSLVDANLTFAREPWSMSHGCDTVARAGSDAILLGATLDDADRESFETTTGETRRESLELSVFATAGDLLEPKAFVDPDDTRAAASVAVEWLPPEEVPADGLNVTFTFIASDLRGGIDAVVRTACVLP